MREVLESLAEQINMDLVSCVTVKHERRRRERVNNTTGSVIPRKIELTSGEHGSDGRFPL